MSVPNVTLADSARGRVIASMCQALRAMTIAGGYHWDVQHDSVMTEIDRELSSLPASMRPVFLVQGTDEGTREYRPAMQVVEEFVVLISCVLDAAPDPNRPVSDRRWGTVEVMAAEIERALTADITRGGLVPDTRLRQPTFMLGAGSETRCLVEMKAVCQIHRTYGDAA